MLGRHGGRLLYAEHRHALVAFGPPQSGKSAGIAVPALLEWDGPAVASSIKTDLLSATIARRRALGEVFVFDPFGLSGVRAHTWSPLEGAHTWDGALEVAWRLASAGELDRRSVEGGDFWAVAAEQRLAPLLYAAAVSGAGMDSVVRWIHGQGIRELDQALLCAGEGGHAAYDAVRAFEAQADRTRTSIEATAQTLLRAYRFGRVVRSAQSSEITADRLLDSTATLYLIGDAKASKLLRPIFLALLGEVVDRAYERATLAGGRLDKPLLLCLDEAGNVAPLPNLAEIASTAPSHNIQLVTIFHDLAQARSRYGQQAETVVNSHRARMLLPGVADLETLRYFAGLDRRGGGARPHAHDGRRRDHALDVAPAAAADRARGATTASRPPRAAAVRPDPAGATAPEAVVRGPATATARGCAMSRPEPDDWHEPENDWEEPVSARWPLCGDGLYPRERWMWYEQLWSDVCALRARYRLALRSGWWEDQVQVEALAALSAWVERYDSGEWDDPPGKLALLYDLERVAALLRDGGEPFHPDRDRLAFARYLIELGCQPPPDR